MEIEIISNDVKSLNIDHLKSLSINPNDWQVSGISEYRLYAYLSTLFNQTTILDIGTRTGGSALALSYNPKNNVRSYDIVEQGASSIRKENVSWIIAPQRNWNSKLWKLAHN
jgi:tRNA1(Val) A37 N6-methylase TrmN6